MALNLEAIGKEVEPTTFEYDQDRVILYALGIGASVDELDFVYEKALKVFPTFAVIPVIPAMIHAILNTNLNIAALLHGEQKITLHRPIPPKGTIKTIGGPMSAYDKGDKGALVNCEFKSFDEAGESLFDNKIVLIDRSAGNFNGDRGPAPEKFDPPEGREPDFKVEETTSVDQAALYRLSGDKNPLHIDPEFAQMAGLSKPILHGLCTYGFAGRAILHSVCDGDPARFKSFATRFTGMVMPGDTLITEGWQIESGRYVVRTITGDGRLVLGNALAETAWPPE
jgi:acyl dehydratase